MNEGYEDTTLIVRVQGPWGISRVFIDKHCSLADLKRDLSRRVDGLPESSSSIALFLDKNCSNLLGGGSENSEQDSLSLSRLNLRSGDKIYAQPVNETVHLSVENSSGQTNEGNDGGTPGPSSGTANSRLVKSYGTSNFGDYTIRAAVGNEGLHSTSLLGGTSPVHVVGGRIQAVAATKATRLEQQRRRNAKEASRLRRKRNHRAHPLGFVDPAVPSMMDASGKPRYVSWGKYLEARGIAGSSVSGSNSFGSSSSGSRSGALRATGRGMFDLERKPRPHVINRGGAPNVIPDPFVINQQHYRHVDYIEFFNQDEVNRFVGFWLNNGMLVQRVGLMYGKYEDDEVTEGGTKLVIHGIYEPPQRIDKNGGVRLLHDPREKDITKTAKAARLENIGWIFTHPPRDQPITSMEAHLMAKFQNAHMTKDPLTGLRRSRYAAVTITRNIAGEVVPRGFMVSDQGMVLDSSGIWARGDNAFQCNIVRERPGSILPAVTLAKNSANYGVDSMQQPTQSIEPKALLVDVECGPVRVHPAELAQTAAKKYQSRQLFFHTEFQVENRAEYGEVQSDTSAHEFLSRYRAEPLERRISDFHFLFCMPNFLKMETVENIAKALGSKNSLDQTSRNIINAYISSAN